MQLSNRITGLNGGGSDGWGLFLKARRMMAEGHDVIELTIGEHDIKTAAPILQEMHARAMGGHTGYAMVPGTDRLRDTVAARVQARTGVPTTRDNVLITPGGQSALFAAHMAALDPGDVALYVDPYYATYPGTLRSASAIPRVVPAHAHNAFQPSLTDLEPAAKGARSLLINSPNNPTGVVYSEKTLQDIADLCQAENLWLISDEVYDTQIWEGDHLSPRALPGMVDRTMVIGSMSKSHAMTGSRIGWLVAPQEVIANLINLATNTTYGVTGYIQDAADYALKLGPEFEEEVAAPFLRRRTLAREILGQQNTVGLVPSGGAMYLMLDIRATGLSGEDFGDQLLDTHGIAVMPGESFGAAAAGHIRVAMTIEDSRFAAALQQLCAFAESLAQNVKHGH